MRAAGIRGILVYCADYHCSHATAISADQWPDHARLSDLEPRFICKAWGKKALMSVPTLRAAPQDDLSPHHCRANP
jgi:hypothetical protein